MEKQQRSKLQTATQDARRLLEEEFRSQLLQTYDIDVEKVRWAEEPGAHLQAEQRLIRKKLVAWIEHKEAQIHDRKEALLLALREMAFTALNRFVALKLMEARELVRPCVSGGMESAGFLEFTAVAQGLLADQESSYRLYLETIFEDVSRELRALFDPRDPASLLWPKRAALLELLEIVNRPELAELWIEDETLGWVYQYFNGDAERKKMREESSAPRNSRELAVRNQFFTPRYVVEFLTDNTLGRIWYEMRQSNTGLKDRCRYLVQRPNEVWLQQGEEPPADADADETLSQEELLRQPVYIPHRPLKDPREIRMLDPACGSMHFGLYAFDLYLEIYKEAWEIAQGSGGWSQQDKAFSPFVAYTAGFADKSAFLREVPRLILQHNIHGIDIDPRATQIARLTLWLRAQRAWREKQLRVADRPTITRSNVVCAEPMPGEKELHGDFVEQQFPAEERPAFAFLLEKIFECMSLAGEAGSLLRIEDEIRSSIAEARALARSQAAPRQTALFAGIEKPEQAELDLGGLNDEQFWQAAEQRIYEALEAYAEQAESGGGLQRRLFADDAAQGFAFIDLCRKRYDVVVMNPPFGLGLKTTDKYLQASYISSGSEEVAASFYTRTLELLSIGGRIGEISSRTCFFLPTLSEWRKEIVFRKSTLEAFVDLGEQVLDGAFNETSAYIAQKDRNLAAWAVFGMLHREGSPDLALVDLAMLSLRPEICPRLLRDLEVLPDRPLCYWTSNEFVRALRNLSPMGDWAAEVQMGLAPRDEFRFSRLWWEVTSHDVGRGRNWPGYAKGGELSPYYSDVELLLLARDDLAEIKAALNHKYPYLKGNLSWVLHPENDYFRPGLTFGQRTTFLRMSVLPGDCYFSVAGKGVFGRKQSTNSLLQAINTPAAQFLTYLRRESLSMNPQFQEGDVARIPWPEIEAEVLMSLEKMGEECVAAVRAIASFDEVDHAFKVFSSGGESQHAREVGAATLSRNEGQANELLSRLLGLSEVDYEFIEREIKPKWQARSVANWHEPQESSALVSYIFGVLFGRWDIRYATGVRPAPELPDPFAPLPVCPPGMLQGDDGLPLSPETGRRLQVEGQYPLDVAWDGILVDDPEHPLHLERRVHAALTMLWADRVAEMQEEACSLLGVPSLREWFRRPAGFFADHLKQYSKSRRQAPIYWPLSAGSGNYSVWLYYHRFNADTLYRVLRDFVEPRLQQVEREQFEFESQGGLSGDDASRLQGAQALLHELRLLKSELDLVAPLWNPNLNDGVIINHAILWRITPYTPWQKKCMECWDKLVRGDYDWAHLAFHLWPERVIPKCTTDRSLAIAHGLEERLWQETNNGNWLPRQLSEADLQALISEHSNPAVKSALERFLAAPPPVAPTRTRASRSTRASGSSTPRRARGSAAVVDAEATRQVLLALTAAPSDGLAKTQIADLIGVEANALTAVIKQLKESGQIDQLGERRGARYVLSEQGRATVAADAGEDA